MQRKPPLVEVWHWSWLDPRWTAPLAWWLAWDPAAVPVGGSDWHRPGSDAVPGTPTTWVECAGGGGDGPGAVLAGLRAGRCAISAGRDGPVLLRLDGEFAVAGGDGTRWPGRTARARWSAAIWPHSPPPLAVTGCSTRRAAPWPSPASVLPQPPNAPRDTSPSPPPGRPGSANHMVVSFMRSEPRE